MPQLIKFIDAIARKKGRDVLFVEFPPCGVWQDNYIDYQDFKPRDELIQWLEETGFTWECCGPFAQTNMMSSYDGRIYIDVPFDRNDPQYQKLEAHLENPDGSMKIEGVKFWALSLQKAMENAHHDEPGFWKKWAENF